MKFNVFRPFDLVGVRLPFSMQGLMLSSSQENRLIGGAMMSKNRLTAFIDAVMAIVMTILVLDLKIPEQITFAGFWGLRD